MRRPRARRLLVALAWAALLYPIADYVYWHRRGGSFNHR